mmetsp:Transcript_4756/g.11888  ORF Transcript_4756/g.11888 Transcript_4756/m.11888 type:complete len:156 (+) Transcript_4756:1007-1474(+)
MRRSAFPPRNRRRQEIAWPPRKRRFGCGVGSVGLKAPSFKDTAQKRWNREAKAADRADHRWRHEEAAAERKRQDQAAAAAFEAEEEDAARRWEEEMAAALPPPPPKALSPEKRARIERNRAAALALKRRKLSDSRGRDGMPGVGAVRGIQEAGSS